MFVAFSREELGMLGSADFCEDLVPDYVTMNVNIEMLGRPNGKRPFIIEDENNDFFLSLLNKNLVKAGIDYPKRYFVRDPYPEQNLFNRSDNYSFYKSGIASFTIMATDPADIYYHSANDEIETIQFDQMQKIVEAIYWAMLPVIMGE
jgi:Zn-dependent M28 family amino/carboxypeptidase